MSLLRFFLLTLIFGASPLQAALKVSVGIEPMRYLIEEIGGERVAVSTLLSSGDPHTLDPTPRQLWSLKQADLYFAVGLPFERGLGERLGSAEKLLWLDENKEDEDAERLAEQHDHRPIDGKDPHRWTGPAEMLRMGAVASETLRQLDPEGDVYYSNRLQQFSRRVEALQQRVAEILISSAPTMVADHPAWGWFCQEFSLRQLSVEQEGKLPSIRQMSALKKEAKNSGARYVVSQHGGTQAQTLAAHLGLQLLVINPLNYQWEDNLAALATGLASP